MGRKFSGEAAKKCDKCIQMHNVGQKLCHHRKQVWRWQKNSDEAEKVLQKCIQMHDIGKMYVTTVYKCDDENKWSPSLSETTVTFVDNVF